jgi:hypothetical protein
MMLAPLSKLMRWKVNGKSYIMLEIENCISVNYWRKLEIYIEYNCKECKF